MSSLLRLFRYVCLEGHPSERNGSYMYMCCIGIDIERDIYIYCSCIEGIPCYMCCVVVCVVGVRVHVLGAC